ncbi:hypothetical protein [Actinokineospora terrae]|uniref:Uncharacterized protein n=1 Tax=Actinokineospora terrae TaxID=155974 RepID=A0A1H9VF72_9PSEU|nr:hypothetical protein [Actinokineospora terrae]SES20209.1 hypothetical protein SAMN04487818_108311 [Actinokineospora terrae]
MRDTRRRGRHRLGTPGLVHCTEYLSVPAHRTWWSMVLMPARHSLAGLRRRAAAAAVERAWAPQVRTA